MASALLADVSDALRRLRADPVACALAVAMLSAGIGANAALFSAVDAVVLRPFAFAEQERLVVIWDSHPDRGQPVVDVSYPDFLDWQRDTRSFAGLAAHTASDQKLVWSGAGEAVELRARLVSAGFFSVLGVPPARGRALRPDDDRAEAGRVVVLSDGVWRRRFGGDPEAVGRVLVLEGTPHSVVGVMPPEFDYPQGTELWTSLVPAVPQYVDKREVGWLRILGRLAPGVRLEQAQSELGAVATRLARSYDPTPTAHAVVVTPLVAHVVGDARGVLLTMMGCVALVLAAACANVAGLLLVRAHARRRDAAIRMAVGAGRGRLVRERLMESVVIAGVAGALGLLLARWGIDLLAALAPADLPRASQIRLDLRVMAVCAAASVVVAALTSIAPALAAIRTNPIESMRASAPERRSGRLGPALVAIEVALAFVVLAGAGLMLRSHRRLTDVALGFVPAGAASIEVNLPDWKYREPAARRELFARLVERARLLPGVEAAGGVLLRPLWGSVGLDWPFSLEAQSPEEASRNPPLNLLAVTPGYFRAAGIPLKRGRDLEERDGHGAAGVAVVSEALAHRAWPGADAVGRRIQIPLPGTPYDGGWLEVVGVVGDVRHRELRQGRLELYVSFRQCPYPLRHVIVRAQPGTEPARLLPLLRAELLRLDPDVPASEAVTLDEVVSEAQRPARFAAQVLAAFGVTALLLAGLGLYGVLAQAVALRTREIGVRVALGAGRRRIVTWALRRGAAPLLLGVLAGLAAAWPASRVPAGVAFDVAPGDPPSFALAAALLLAVAALAGSVPAWRALHVEPARALRDE